jgi:hypothetical protein
VRIQPLTDGLTVGRASGAWCKARFPQVLITLGRSCRGESLSNHDSKRVNIVARMSRLSVKSFWSEVTHRAGLMVLTGGAGRAEVGEKRFIEAA